MEGCGDFDFACQSGGYELEVFARGNERSDLGAEGGLDTDAILGEFAVDIGVVEGDDGRDIVGAALADKGIALDEQGVALADLAVELLEVVLQTHGVGREAGGGSRVGAGRRSRAIGLRKSGKGGGRKERQEEQIPGFHNSNYLIYKSIIWQKYILKLIDKYPNSYLGHKKLAEIYEKQNNLSNAIDEYVAIQ